MAKKQTDLNIFSKTEYTPGEESEADNSDLDEGNIKAMGVGLRGGEVAALDAMAGELGIARNQLLRFAIRWFILQVRSGAVDLQRFIEEPPPPKKNLRLP